MGYFSLELIRSLYITLGTLLISGLHKNALTFKVEGTLNKNTVQCQHFFFLLNIEINKIVNFVFVSLFVFSSFYCRVIPV